MDKLISADKFIKEIDELAGIHKFEYHELRFSTNDILNNIEAQPRVEAIPISWIFQNGLRRSDPAEREAIVKLINEFEEEYRKSRKE